MTKLQVLVAGTGVMGRGIARSFAAAGIPTAALSRNPGAVGDLDPRVELLSEPPAEPPELVIETVPEVMELKQALYARLEAAWAGAPILASNTSGLSLQALADGLLHPQRFVGIHYFQPADVTPVVEVARVRQTDEAVFERAAALMRACGKLPLLLREPVPGLLINRLQHAILHEAYHLIERGVTTAADVDLAAKELLGPRMSVTGLIEQKDISGLDTHALAQAAIVPELHHGAQPLDLVQAKRRADEIGVKTGRGFYDWRGFDPGYRAKANALLARLLDLLSRERPAGPPLARD
jgi:3-hydroxybutyryl-CoA dehydrogenase